MSFIDRLLSLMKEREITAYRLAKQIGISESVISKWQKNPNADPSSIVLYKISDFFQVSMKWLLTGEGEMLHDRSLIPNLTNEEQELLKNYKKLDEPDKIRIMERINTLIDVKEQTKSLTNNVKPFRPRQTKPSLPKQEITYKEPDGYKVFDIKASAGLGSYLDDDSTYELLYFDEDEVPYKADFGIRITGNSMEPKIHDGDVVWVEEKIQIENGQIGIFIVDGYSYCKKLSIDYDKRKMQLISLNKQYPPIEITEDTQLRTIGRVLL